MTDAVVIGGGLAGASLASLLAREGRSVTLLEREAGPVDKVCGEFLSGEAARYVAAMGLNLAALGAVPIESVRLVVDRRVVTARLPFPAVSLSRRVLDEAMLELAARQGARVHRGVAVRGLTPFDDGWSARLADGTAVGARDAFVATGKHDLRGWKRERGTQGDLVAFKLYLRLRPAATVALEGHVELILFRDGYAGLQPVEGGRANLCLLVRRRRLAEIGAWEALLAALRAESPHLASRLEGAAPCTARPLSLAAIPYGYVRRRSDGVWRLGDQAAVIPSFSGDGMSIALHSARLAATTYLGGGDAKTFQRRLAKDVTGQVRLATALSLGLVRRPIQRLVESAACLMPALMREVAGRTRVRDSALVRAGLEPPHPSHVIH